MINRIFLEQLDKKDLRLSIKPFIDTHQYEVCSFYGGKMEYGVPESQVYTLVSMDIEIVDDYDERKEMVGQAEFWVINAHNFRKSTFISVDGEDGEMSSHLEALKYLNHERNFVSKGFEYPYQAFVILNRLYIEEKFRGKGIGQFIIKNTNKMINDMLNLDTTILQWAAWPITGINEVKRDASEEELKQLHKFARKVGAKTLYKEDDLKYFIYHYDELEGLGE